MSTEPSAGPPPAPMQRIDADRRRRLLGLLLACAWHRAGASAGPPAGASAEVWLELSEPVAAASTDAQAMQAQQHRVATQQHRIGARLRELGIEEIGRVRHARNAIAVRVTPRQAEQARAIAGVLRLRPTRALHPPVPAPRPTE